MALVGIKFYHAQKKASKVILNSGAHEHEREDERERNTQSNLVLLLTRQIKTPNIRVREVKKDI